MNALVKKEIRLLLPSFSLVIALTFANCFLTAELSQYTPVGVVSFILCPVVVIFMALNSFGVELSSGTFSMLLAQPVSRGRILRTKAALLAAALLIGGFLWSVLLIWNMEPFLPLQDFLNLRTYLLVGAWLFLLVVYSGAFWTVLLLRQMAAAFWFTLLIPGVIVGTLAAFLQVKHPVLFEDLTVASLVIYSVAGLIFARVLFLRTQDAQWTGGTIVLPEMRGAATFLSRALKKRWWRPEAVLFWKELQLHQSQFVLAGMLLLLHLGVLAFRKLGNVQRNSIMELFLESWMLWLVMPLLVGATAVAEERKLGTLTAQLCLPVRRRTQFAVKLRMTLWLSVLFGALMPLLLEGSRILPNFALNFFAEMSDVAQQWRPWEIAGSRWDSFLWNFFDVLGAASPFTLLLTMVAAIGLISFFISSLSRNMLQALAPSVFGIIASMLLCVGAFQPEPLFHYPLWHGWLIELIGLPVCGVVLIALSFSNFQRILPGWKVWRTNIMALLAALTFVICLTTALYHRIWEKLTPLEAQHGAARLFLADSVSLREPEWSTESVRLPGGKVWTDGFLFETPSANPWDFILGNFTLTSQGDAHYYPGSNWLNVTGAPWLYEKAGIKTDGTLWVSGGRQHVRRLEGVRRINKPEHFVQFGAGTNWSSLVFQRRSMLLVKNDGTLWRWGTTNWRHNLKPWQGLQSFVPYRLGTESNWAEVSVGNPFSPQFRKIDGSVWGESYNRQKGDIDLEPGIFLRREWLAGNNWRHGTTVTAGRYQFGIRQDGIFGICAELRKTGQPSDYQWAQVDFPLDTETNWLNVAAGPNKIVALKNDGTLWVWNFYRENQVPWDRHPNKDEMLVEKPVRLSTHSDWVAIANAEAGIVSLAADGSLWSWPLGNEFLGDNGFETLLDIPQKPKLVDNIFNGSISKN